MSLNHSPRQLDEPIGVPARLSTVNPATSPSEPTTGQEVQAAQRLADHLSVQLELDQALINRLFTLWNTVLRADADEIGDWSLSAKVELQPHEAIQVPPELQSLGAQVYASGEVSLCLTFEGVPGPLWLEELIDLNWLETPFEQGVDA